MRFLPSNFALAESRLPAEGTQALEHGADHVPTATPGDTTGEQAEAIVAAMPAAGDQQVCFTGETAALLAQDRFMFESSEEALEEQKLKLQTWETELKAQTAELQALQQTLEARWEQMQTASDNDLKHLSTMYGSMKPDQAAEIFNQMDPAFAAGFLRELSGEQAGLILARMETNKAYVVSVKLATLNADIRQASQQ